jgi:hypothetical protein
VPPKFTALPFGVSHCTHAQPLALEVGAAAKPFNMRSTVAAMQASFLEKFVNGEAPLPSPHALRTATETDLHPRLPSNHVMHKRHTLHAAVF